MLHACGWLEGGLVSSPEKFILDADQLGILHSLSEGVDMSDDGQALSAIEEVGPGGHFLGCSHTQANFKNAFWKSQVLDYKPFETWHDDGAFDTAQFASKRVDYLLSNYVAPPIDSSVKEELIDFVARKKSDQPDKFY